MTARPASPEIDGDKLRTLRQMAGLSVQVFARKVGVTPPYISAIELGRRPTVSPDTYVRICNAIGIPSEDREQLRRTRIVESASAA